MGRYTEIVPNANAARLHNKARFESTVVYSDDFRNLFLLGGEGLINPYADFFERLFVRTFDPFGEHSTDKTFDNKFHLTHTVDETIYRMNQLIGHLRRSNVWHAFGLNEPTSGNIPQLVDWLVEFAAKTAENNYKCTIGEIAVAKTFNAQDFVNGVWDPLIHEMQKYRYYKGVKDWHILTTHTYTTGALQFSLLPGYPLNLDNKDKAHQYPDRIRFDVLDGNYHIGRESYYFTRERQLGYAEPVNFAITEGLHDRMDDIDNGAHRGVLTNFERMYGEGRFNGNIRGVRAHYKLFAHLIGDSNPDAINAYIAEQYRFVVDKYPDNLLFIAIFADNENWYEPEGFDIGQDEFISLYREMAAINVSKREPQDDDEPPPVEPPEDYEATDSVSVQSTGLGVRIRLAPSIGATIVGKIDDVRTVKAFVYPYADRVFLDTVKDNGYEWLMFLGDDDTRRYAALFELEPETLRRVGSPFLSFDGVEIMPEDFLPPVEPPADKPRLIFQFPTPPELVATDLERDELIERLEWQASNPDATELQVDFYIWLMEMLELNRRFDEATSSK